MDKLGASGSVHFHSNDIADETAVRKFIIEAEETPKPEQGTNDELAQDKLTLERFLLGLGLVGVILFTSALWALATPLPLSRTLQFCSTSHLPFHLCLLYATFLSIVVIISLCATLDNNRFLLIIASLLLVVLLLMVSTVATAISECSILKQQQNLEDVGEASSSSSQKPKYNIELCQEMLRRYVLIAVLSATSSVYQVATVARIGMTLKARGFTISRLSKKTFVLTYIPVET